VKIRPRDEDIADVRRLEGGDLGLFLGNQKAAEGREVASDDCAVDGFDTARFDQFLGLTRQGDDIVPKNANADVVKIVICKHNNVALFFR
jgi:hypothetical protein